MLLNSCESSYCCASFVGSIQVSQSQLDLQRVDKDSARRDYRPQYRFPDFILAGVMKSGTTSLHAVLAHDPRIFIPDREVFFFDMDDPIQHGEFFYRDDGRWVTQPYLPQDEGTLRWYSRFFEEARDDQLVGEDSTLYLDSTNAPQRIAQFLPNAKVIILLRDPASRTYSHYWHLVRTGRAVYRFEDSLRFGSRSLIQRSFYKTHVQRYRAAFDDDRLLIVVFEEFIRDMEAVVRRVYKFLGLENPPALDLSTTHRNEALTPRWLGLQLWHNWLLRRYTDRRCLDHLLNAPSRTRRRFNFMGLCHAAHRLVNPLRPRRPPPMDPATRRFLNEMFARENDGLSELIGTDVSQYWYRD